MNTFLAVAAGLGLLIVAFFALRLRPKKAQERGFLELVKDPDGLLDFEEELNRRMELIDEFAKLPPEVLGEMLVEDQESDLVARALRKIGADAAPTLHELLKDARVTGSDSAAVERVLECLQGMPAAVRIQLVAPWASDAREPVRKEVALLLGSTGRADAVAPLTSLLRDEREYVRSRALMGINRAVDDRRVSPEFAAGLFSPVAALCFSRSYEDGEAPGCLLGLDRERAITFLAQQGRLQAGQENLHRALESLVSFKVLVDEQILLDIWNQLEANPKYFDDYVLAATLPLLAMHDSEQARQVIERATRHPVPKVRKGAALAKARLIGLDDPLRSAWAPDEGEDWSDFSEPRRHVSAVQILDADVCNGGFWQYFFNPSGDLWPDAMAGLEAIGAKHDRELVGRALAMFAQPLSTDREQRARQLSELAEQDEKAFHELEQSFFKDQDCREVLLLEYVLKHPDDFRPKPTPH
jgi:HEAT repeat protein